MTCSPSTCSCKDRAGKHFGHVPRMGRKDGRRRGRNGQGTAFSSPPAPAAQFRKPQVNRGRSISWQNVRRFGRNAPKTAQGAVHPKSSWGAVPQSKERVFRGKLPTFEGERAKARAWPQRIMYVVRKKRDSCAAAGPKGRRHIGVVAVRGGAARSPANGWSNVDRGREEGRRGGVDGEYLH